MKTNDRLSLILRALADARRRQLFSLLLEHGKINIAKLSDLSGINRHSVMQHLVPLEKAGLIEGRQVGRSKVLEASLDEAVWAHRSFWEPLLGAHEVLTERTAIEEEERALEVEAAPEEPSEHSIAWILD